MTEWYHSTPYYGGEQSVTYSDKGAAIPSAWLWMDEFSVSQRGIGSALFSDSSPSPVTFTNPTQLQTLSSNGATEAANATEFITGQITPVVLLTFGYSVAGGTVLPPAPVLTYYAAGVKETATLTQSEQAFSVDTGTSWSITNPLSSSTTTERWQTNQVTTGTATSPQTIDFVFYHQYLVTFRFQCYWWWLKLFTSGSNLPAIRGSDNPRNGYTDLGRCSTVFPFQSANQAHRLPSSGPLTRLRVWFYHPAASMWPTPISTMSRLNWIQLRAAPFRS